MNFNSTRNSNGRVDINGPRTEDLFQMYDRIPANQCATYRNPVEGIWNNTELSNGFFSEKNITTIQNGMRQGVYERSNGQYVIGVQDGDTLKIIMRSIFLQYAANKPTDIKQQIYELNKMVWDYTIPQLYGEAQGYHKYIHDASTMYKPMDPPILAKNNDKQLVLKPWF
jgi:hypothetical protein